MLTFNKIGYFSPKTPKNQEDHFKMKMEFRKIIVKRVNRFKALFVVSSVL